MRKDTSIEKTFTFFMTQSRSTLRQLYLFIQLLQFRFFDIFYHDLTQAYFQDIDKLLRNIFLHPELVDLKILRIRPKENLELIRPVLSL